jgi:hypothetical protein
MFFILCRLFKKKAVLLYFIHLIVKFENKNFNVICKKKIFFLTSNKNIQRLVQYILYILYLH